MYAIVNNSKTLEQKKTLIKIWGTHRINEKAREWTVMSRGI